MIKRVVRVQYRNVKPGVQYLIIKPNSVKIRNSHSFIARLGNGK